MVLRYSQKDIRRILGGLACSVAVVKMGSGAPNVILCISQNKPLWIGQTSAKHLWLCLFLVLLYSWPSFKRDFLENFFLLRNVMFSGLRKVSALRDFLSGCFG